MPAHYKCTNASRNLTGYMSRPPGSDTVPLPMAPPPVPEARSYSSTDVPVPSSNPYIAPPPKAPPNLAFFRVVSNEPREFEVHENRGTPLLRAKASSSMPLEMEYG